MTLSPSAPSALRTPAGLAEMIIGSLAAGKARYHIDGVEQDIDVTIPDDLKDSFFWNGPCLTLDVPPSQCGLCIDANMFGVKRAFELARVVLQREQDAQDRIVQKRMF